MWLFNFDRMVQKWEMGAWKGKFGNLEYGEELVGVKDLDGRPL